MPLCLRARLTAAVCRLYRGKNRRRAGPGAPGRRPAGGPGAATAPASRSVPLIAGLSGSERTIGVYRRPIITIRSARTSAFVSNSPGSARVGARF